MKAIWMLFGACICVLPVNIIEAKDQVKILALEPQSDEEAFLVRRIAEFWKDGDYQIVQSQILTFLEKYPESTLRDHLKGILGDLYLQKDQYERALDVYNDIGRKDVYEKTLINKMQCLYELGQYKAISESGLPFLTNSIPSVDERRDEFNFLMAESFFRRSLTQESREVKAELAARAKPLYHALDGSIYSGIAEFALAEIYRQLGDFPDAARMYQELATKHPDQREDLLFHAGNLQAQFKPEQAIATFSEIIALGGVRAGEATFNRMLIYYQLGHYHDVINAYDHVQAYIPENKQNLFHLVVGKSHFSTEDYPNAIHHLRTYSENQEVANVSLKNALLMLMTASYHQGDVPLFNETFSKFKTHYSDDPEMSKAIFTHAMLAKAGGDFATVQTDLELLLTSFPDYEDQEGLMFEYASLTYEHQDWQKSHRAFHTFLEHYPESERNDVAWRYYFSSSLNLYKEAQANENIHYSKGAFYEDLSSVLDQPGVLGDDERREYRMLQAKTAYELDLFEVTYGKLQSYIGAYPNDPSLAEAHFLSGLASKEINHDLQPVCYHLEKALELGSNFYDTASVHLELYNAYLTLSTLAQDNNAFLCKAALHLYDAAQKNTQPIKNENLLWLANHFYEQSKNVSSSTESIAAAERAFAIFTDVLTPNHNGEVVAIAEDSLFLEAEVLKLANLFEQKGDQGNKLAILKSMANQQNTHPEWNWQFQRQTLLELAKTHEAAGNREQALTAYSFISETAKYSPSPLSYVALLKEARLRYDLMSPENKNENHPEMISVLNNLKELQIKKQLNTEPIHLEAAIDYALIRAELAANDEQLDRHLFFLKRIRDDFAPSEDPISVDYYTQLEQQPQKNHLFQLHMHFVEAEILRLEAALDIRNQNVEEAQHKVFAAGEVFHDIRTDSLATPYLKSRVEEAQLALDAIGI